MPADPRKQFGNEGERAARDFLVENGYRIVEENFRTLFGEIDLIAQKKQELHFVEVKTRSNNTFMPAEEAVNTRKQEKIRKTAQAFLSSHKARLFQGYEIYLDIITVISSSQNKNFEIKHWTGAF